ncbi:MAG: TetR/AcrR family transcriptional regulator [Deltaproteobacteria bacterium]|nr:TetR/AcrR family transcriptional regulator [Deltaproteobacteria bacterium]
MRRAPGTVPRAGGGKLVRAVPKSGNGDVAVRERLLAGAAELFTRKGYASTTVRAIVEKAGVTKPVLYYYFRNKEGIFLELMGRALTEFDARLEATKGESGRATDKLLRLADRVFVLFVEHIDVARVMYSIYYGPPQGAPFFDFDAYHLRFREAIRRLVEEGIRKGEFRRGDAESMTWALLGAINVAMEVQLCHPEIGLGKEGLASVLAVIFEGIAAERPVARKGASARRGAAGGAVLAIRKGARKGGRR